MSIRPATWDDLPAIGEVGAAAFMDEELFGKLKHPFRKQYPEDFKDYWRRTVGQHMLDPRYVTLVATDVETGKVVGFADWGRQGKGGESRALKLQPPPTTPYPLTDAFTNRAANMSQHTLLEETYPLIAHFWDGPRSENWNLDALAVHPDFEGKGHGKRLVRWGIEEAKREGITTGVTSADGKEGFYENFGFVQVGRANVGRLKEEGVKGGAILFIDV